MRLAAVTVFACAACAKVGEPLAESDPLVTVFGDDTVGLTVTTALNQMVFRGGGMTELHWPEQLLVAGADILGTSMQDQCSLESLVGVAMFPGVVAAANLTNPDAAATVDELATYLSINRAGPAFASVEVGFGADYICIDSEQKLRGRSVFNFLPNGRIDRIDAITPSTTDLTPAGDVCGCSPTANTFIFTSFWAFTNTAQRTVNREGAVLPGPNPAAVNVNGACTIYNDGRAVAVQFDPITHRIEPNDTVAHVRDILRSPMPIVASEVFVQSSIKTTDAGISNGDCGTLLASMVDPPLEIDGTPVAVNSDGIYAVPDETGTHESTFTIANRGTTPVPGNFTVSIDLGTTGHLRVSGPSIPIPERAVRSYREDLSRAPDDPARSPSRYTLVFVDSLPPGAEITVELF